MSHKQQVKCLETGATYESARAAAQAMNCSQQLVSHCCVGRTKTCKGFHLEYVHHHPITIHNKAVIEAGGHRINGNCKSVTVLELNMTFDSVLETAEYLGVSINAVSSALCGRAKTVHGYHVYFTKEANEHMEAQQTYNREMIARIPALEEKANIVDKFGINEVALDELARLRAYREFKATVDAMREEYLIAKTKYEKGMEMLAEMVANL